MSTEPHHNFNVAIELPSGRIVKTRELAVSEWHAIDKAYTKHRDVQDDRSKYTILKSLIRVSMRQI